MECGHALCMLPLGSAGAQLPEDLRTFCATCPNAVPSRLPDETAGRAGVRCVSCTVLLGY